jgi:glutathione synthase/RimK-type ligase-like ATP-grasp enzyme
MPYNMASESAKILADKLKCVRIRRENSRYRHKEDHTVINWGCPERPEHIPAEANVINQFDAVKRACNKKEAFRALNGVGVQTPEVTESNKMARAWLEGGYCVLARTILNGHGGKGIVIMDGPDDLIEAPLYTRYIPKKSEWRIHVFNGVVVDATRKVLSEDHPDKKNVNWKVRNHDNGFIFQRYNPKKLNMDGTPALERDLIPSSAKAQAIAAVAALGLDFGAVDIIWNASMKRAFVLEVNTAPGVAETTSDIYAQFFRAVADKEDKPFRIVDEPVRKVAKKRQGVFDLIVDEVPAPRHPNYGEWPVWPRPVNADDIEF